MNIPDVPENVLYALGILDATADSARNYSPEELRHRMRWAAAMIRGDEKEIAEQKEIQMKINAKYEVCA